MGETVGKMPDGFPAGMRVLAVDDSYVALRRLELLLLKCGYKVTVAHHAHEALKFLRANQDDYDLVISDVNMPDMDGFKLLEIVGLEMDLPVIMLSVDADVKRVMKGLKHGAVDYLVKPVRIEELKLIWTHVARRSLGEKKDPDDSSKKLAHAARSEDASCPRLTEKCKDRQKERDDENSSDSDEDVDAPKKSRVTWTSELHAKFINAINQLGIERAYPKKILDIMNIPDLTRENVASHLQKYRKGLKKNAMGFSQQLFNTTGISAYGGSSLSMTINKQGTAFSSFDRFSANVNKNTDAVSSYLPAQQSCNGNACVPSAWFPHPLSHQNNFCRQYMTIPQASQLGTQHPGLTANSYMVKSSTQVLGYQTFAPRSNQIECYAQSSQNPWTSDGDSGSNSVHQLTCAPDYHTADMYLSNNQIENLFSNELDALLASGGELQHFSSCSGIDVEMGAQINQDLLDVQSSNLKDNRGSSPSDLAVFSTENLSTEYTDDLHAALQQFQR